MREPLIPLSSLLFASIFILISVIYIFQLICLLVYLVHWYHYSVKMDPSILDTPFRLYSYFPTVDRAYDILTSHYLQGLFRKGDCRSSDVTFLLRLVIRILDHITGVVNSRCFRCRYLQIRERRLCLTVRLRILRTKLGDARLLESVTLLDNHLKVFTAILRIWSHMRGFRATWPSWSVYVFHHEFQKYLPLA